MRTSCSSRGSRKWRTTRPATPRPATARRAGPCAVSGAKLGTAGLDDAPDGGRGGRLDQAPGIFDGEAVGQTAVWRANPVGVVERVRARQGRDQRGVVREVQRVARYACRERLVQPRMVGQRTHAAAALEQLLSDEATAVAEGAGHDVDRRIQVLLPCKRDGLGW